jgi:hypothetical protein
MGKPGLDLSSWHVTQPSPFRPLPSILRGQAIPIGLCDLQSADLDKGDNPYFNVVHTCSKPDLLVCPRNRPVFVLFTPVRGTLCLLNICMGFYGSFQCARL